MRGRTSRVVLGTLVAATLAGRAGGAGPATHRAGAQAPRLSLPTPDGRTVRTADLVGRVVVVDFWASWCAPCQRSFPELDALFREAHARGLEVLAVNVDEQRKDAEAFLAAHAHRLTVLLDPDARSAEAFGVEAMPTTIVIDRRGLERARHEGYSPEIARAVREEVQRLLAEPAPAAQPTKR